MDNNYYIGVYGLLSFLSVATLTLSLWALLRGGLRAARTLHAALLTAVMRAPMSFFDTTPVGRIVNRFSKDQVRTCWHLTADTCLGFA